MRESTITKRDSTRFPGRRALPIAVEETMGLYHAWLRYLLTLMGADTLRVKVSDVTAVLDGITCTVTREGDEYVIRIDRPREG
jgi:hypothetical protein